MCLIGFAALPLPRDASKATDRPVIPTHRRSPYRDLSDTQLYLPNHRGQLAAWGTQDHSLKVICTRWTRFLASPLGPCLSSRRKGKIRGLPMKHYLVLTMQERQRCRRSCMVGLPDQNSNRGLALFAKSSACCGNQAPAIGSSSPHSGSNTAWPAASVGHSGCV